jgi:hypothetical protein
MIGVARFLADAGKDVAVQMSVLMPGTRDLMIAHRAGSDRRRDAYRAKDTGPIAIVSHSFGGVMTDAHLRNRELLASTWPDRDVDRFHDGSTRAHARCRGR